MKKVMTAGFAISVVAYTATVATAQAENQTARPSHAVSAAPIYCFKMGHQR
jgi:bifunctional DNase/RNase